MKKKSASQSAFFKLRILLGVLLCFGAVGMVMLAQPRTPTDRVTSAPPPFRAQYRGVMPVVKFDISPPLRSMKPLPWKDCTLRENEEQGPIPPGPVGPCRARSSCATGARQDWNTGSDHQFRREQQSLRLLAARSQWRSRSQ